MLYECSTPLLEFLRGGKLGETSRAPFSLASLVLQGRKLLEEPIARRRTPSVP